MDYTKIMFVLAAYLFYFLAASVSPVQRRWLAVHKDGGDQIAFSFQVMFCTATLGLILPLFVSPEFSGSALKIFLLALTAGTTGGCFFISNYTAQKYVDAGITSIISNIYTPVTIVIATLFLNERLQPVQILGTTILIVAMVIVSKKHRVGRFRFDKYFWLMVIGGICLGICLSAERALMKTTGFTTGTLVSWWSQVLILGIATVIFKSKTAYSTNDTLITGGLRFLQALSWVVLLQVVGNLSVVSAVTTFKVVVIFILAAVFLKEKEDMPRKVIGSAIAIVGLLLMK